MKKNQKIQYACAIAAMALASSFAANNAAASPDAPGAPKTAPETRNIVYPSPLADSNGQNSPDAPSCEYRESSGEWDFFGLNFFPGVPRWLASADIFGVKLGAPVSAGSGLVAGVEAGVLGSLTQYVDGVQTSPIFCSSYSINGLQASPVNVANQVQGLQFGIVNICQQKGVQLGVVNYLEDAWIPFTIIFNVKL